MAAVFDAWDKSASELTLASTRSIFASVRHGVRPFDVERDFEKPALVLGWQIGRLA